MDTRSPLHSFSDRLKQLIREVSQRAFDPVGLDEGHFNELARELFSYQVEANSFLKLWVDRSGWDPSQVDRWEMIPCVPTDAFKEFSVTALSESERTAVFRSRGTTRADRGQHFHSITIQVDDTTLERHCRGHACGEQTESLEPYTVRGCRAKVGVHADAHARFHADL